MAKYKQDSQNSKKSQGLDIEGILDGDLSITNIYKVLKNLTPEQIEQGKAFLNQMKGTSKDKSLGPGTTEWR